jgi:phenylacetate-CoA ligase
VQAAPLAILTAKARASAYWNQYVETMPRERLDQLHLRRLGALLRFAYNHSPFYRRKFDQARIKPEDVRTLGDFKRAVPLTDKSEFLYLQNEKPPYGLTVAVPGEVIVHHSETSGTTGSALAIPFSQYDVERYGESWAYGFWAHGIRPEDSIYYAFDWGRFAGFWSAYWGARRMGCRVLSGGGANTKGHIENVMRLQPSAVVCTPTFALRLASVAQEMGVDLAASSVRFTYHAGEPGPYALPAMRKAIDEAWGAKSGELLGIAEVDAIGPGCPNRDGVHIVETQAFSWVMNPATGGEVGEGELGEHIITGFANSAQPLINYRTHDIVRPRYSCGCGRTWLKFEGVVLGRTDYMVTVRGTNVYQAAVENLLGEIKGVSPNYQMILEHEASNDRMTVEMEPEPNVSESAWPALASAVEERIHRALRVRLEVRVVPPGSLPRYDIKTKRIIDRRPKEMRRILDQ